LCAAVARTRPLTDRMRLSAQCNRLVREALELREDAQEVRRLYAHTHEALQRERATLAHVRHEAAHTLLAHEIRIEELKLDCEETHAALARTLDELETLRRERKTFAERACELEACVARLETQLSDALARARALETTLHE